MSLLEEFYERLPYHLGERGPLESRDIGEFSGLAERCDDRRCEARRIRWGETYVWERNAPEFLEVRGHDGPTCSRVFEHLDGACGVEVCVGITGIQTDIRCGERVGCLFVGTRPVATNGRPSCWQPATIGRRRSPPPTTRNTMFGTCLAVSARVSTKKREGLLVRPMRLTTRLPWSPSSARVRSR